MEIQAIRIKSFQRMLLQITSGWVCYYWQIPDSFFTIILQKLLKYDLNDEWLINEWIPRMLQWDMLNRLWIFLVPMIYSCARLSNAVFYLLPCGILKKKIKSIKPSKYDQQIKIHMKRKYSCMDSFIFLK